LLADGEGKIKGYMWEKIGNMVIDSVEDEGVTCEFFLFWGAKFHDFGDDMLTKTS
jgi:hypothetical protein